MRDVAFDEVLSGYRRTHASLLDVARKTDATLFNEVRGAANSIGFNLWTSRGGTTRCFRGSSSRYPLSPRSSHLPSRSGYAAISRGRGTCRSSSVKAAQGQDCRAMTRRVFASRGLKS
jgi:hypothetical protein